MNFDESKIEFEVKQEATFTDLNGEPIYLFNAVSLYRHMASYDYEGHKYFGIGRTNNEAVETSKRLSMIKPRMSIGEETM